MILLLILGLVALSLLLCWNSLLPDNFFLHVRMEGFLYLQSASFTNSRPPILIKWWVFFSFTSLTCSFFMTAYMKACLSGNSFKDLDTLFWHGFLEIFFFKNYCLHLFKLVLNYFCHLTKYERVLKCSHPNQEALKNIYIFWYLIRF